MKVVGPASLRVELGTFSSKLTWMQNPVPVCVLMHVLGISNFLVSYLTDTVIATLLHIHIHTCMHAGRQAGMQTYIPT